MNKQNFSLVLYSVSAVLLFYSCKNDLFEKSYEYEILKAGNPENLIFVDYYSDIHSCIYGIDTTTFTVETKLRMKNMTFGGVAKMPGGGVAFTHNRRISDNAWGNTLYVTDDKYNITGKYPVCYSPMTPKIIGNTLIVGSSGLENGKHPLHLYDIETFQLKNEFLFESEVDAWRISEYGNHAYFGIYDFSDGAYGYAVELDLNTNEITKFTKQVDFFKDIAFGVCRSGNLMYILNGAKKNLCVFDINTNSVKSIVETSSYPEIERKIETWYFFHPRVVESTLCGILSGFYDEVDEAGRLHGYYRAYFVQFDIDTYNLNNITPLDIPVKTGDAGPYTTFYAGSFLVMRVENYVMFVDCKTGNTVKTVQLK